MLNSVETVVYFFLIQEKSDVKENSCKMSRFFLKDS